MYQVTETILEHSAVHLCDDPLVPHAAERLRVCEDRPQRRKPVIGFASSELAAATLWVLVRSCSQVIADGVPEDVVGGFFDLDISRMTRQDDTELSLWQQTLD